MCVGAGVAVGTGVRVAVVAGVAVRTGVGVCVGAGVVVGAVVGVCVGAGVAVGAGAGVCVGAVVAVDPFAPPPKRSLDWGWPPSQPDASPTTRVRISANPIPIVTRLNRGGLLAPVITMKIDTDCPFSPVGSRLG